MKSFQTDHLFWAAVVGQTERNEKKILACIVYSYGDLGVCIYYYITTIPEVLMSKDTIGDPFLMSDDNFLHSVCQGLSLLLVAISHHIGLLKVMILFVYSMVFMLTS